MGESCGVVKSIVETFDCDAALAVLALAVESNSKSAPGVALGLPGVVATGEDD